jgi:hypothetical protein
MEEHAQNAHDRAHRIDPKNFYDGARVVICINCNTRRLSSQRECVECLQRAEDAEETERISQEAWMDLKRAVDLDEEPTNADEVLIHIDLALTSLLRALVVTTDANYAPLLNLASDLKRFQCSLRKEN